MKETRVIGTYPEDLSNAQGALLIAIGGLHGNEPGGVTAAKRVLAELRESRPEFQGALVCLAGNLQALATGNRFVKEDLNRVWTEERVRRLESADPETLEAEEREQRELLDEIEPLLAREWGLVVLLDLHSTSAEGSPFAIMADTLQNRRAANALDIPVLLGLEERVEGTLLSYMSERGHTALCVEGGQNDSPSTVTHHEATLWVSLVEAGLVSAQGHPQLDAQRRVLEGAAQGVPRFVEVRLRQPVPKDRAFAMLPGFRNFQRVKEDDVLAETSLGDDSEDFATPMGGLLIMPRYQGQGDDAFFIGRRVRPFWLRLSAGLRRRHLERLLPLLPGINRDPNRERVLRVNPHVARWLVVQILHLFGYRRSIRQERDHVFVRRRDRW